MTYRMMSVPVAGGELAVGAWGTDGPLVVLVHGITSQHQAWAAVGPRLAADFQVLAPDLRGRGGSRDLPGPYGMPVHAQDIAAVIRSHGGPAILVGHSMGGFASVATARRLPDLVERLVLVDGGAPQPAPPDAEAGVEQAIAVALGPGLARLSMTFESREAYHELWRAHPSFADWSPAVDAYVDYDLIGAAPELRPACRLEAALRDGRDIYALDGVEPRALPVPAVFLRAERGLFHEETPFYTEGYAARWLPGIDERTVAGVNHYSITLGDAGADAVVAAVRAG